MAFATSATWLIRQCVVVYSEERWVFSAAPFVEPPAVQDYKSLYAVVTICATLVDIQTDTQTAFDQVTSRSICGTDEF